MLAPYLLDSNFFIQAHRMHYPLDVFPNFWIRVADLAHDGQIISIDKVYSELATGKDALYQWCHDNLLPDFFKDSKSVLPEYTDLIRWAISRANHYTSAAISDFSDANEADAWLVAYAKAHNNIIVTHEVSDPTSRKRIKIPDAGSVPVPCVNTVEMFRRLGVKL